MTGDLITDYCNSTREVQNENPAPGSAAPPPLLTPVLPPAAPTTRSGLPRFIAIVLSLGLALFLADALFSFLDESLGLFFNLHFLTGFRGIFFAVGLLSSLAIYFLMALTPMVPKRFFVPVALFNPLAAIAVLPCAIYSFQRLPLVSWAVSLCEVIVALIILALIRSGLKPGSPLVPVVPLEKLNARRFSWSNLLLFLLANLFLLAPAVIIYLLLCAGMATSHFSEGFLKLRPGGFTVQARKYVRSDGKTIELFPMAHIGDSGFYQKIAQSFPTNSIILMEGVSDENNLLTNKISYNRAATSLGLSEQQKEFRPTRGEVMPADVDIGDFTTNTIGFLNLVMKIHSRGVNLENLLQILQYSPAPDFQRELFDDLLHKRNRHLLGEIHSHLDDTENLVIPWGVAHMPEVSREIQKDGFSLTNTTDYRVIRFGSGRKSGRIPR